MSPKELRGGFPQGDQSECNPQLVGGLRSSMGYTGNGSISEMKAGVSSLG